MANQPLLDQIFFDYLAPDEVEKAHEIEQSAYPPGEAGSLEAFMHVTLSEKFGINTDIKTLTRQRQKIPRLFLGAYLPSRTLIGYVNATLSKEESFLAESMHHHDPDGSSVCLHGIAVLDSHRHCGLGSALLKDYICRLREYRRIGTSRASRILLICHEPLVRFYTRAGFYQMGKSPVVHGSDSWIEMKLELDEDSTSNQGSVSSDILGVLSDQNRSSSRPYSSFPDLTSLVSSRNNNAFDIVCPRDGCGSLILKAGNAKYRRAPSFDLEPLNIAPAAPLQRLPPSPSEVDWWIVSPSPYVFENIAFSKPIHSSSAIGQPKTKLLACAECDLGAFGWSQEGSTEFQIAASRVAYR